MSFFDMLFGWSSSGGSSSNISVTNGRVSVNGAQVDVDVTNGSNISVTNGRVFVNGVKVDVNNPDKRPIHITIEGSCHNVTSDGPVTVMQNVNGNVKANGSATVHGNTRSVNCGGSLTCGEVTGNAEAGGSITAGKILGSVMAGGSIRHG